MFPSPAEHPPGLGAGPAKSGKAPGITSALAWLNQDTSCCANVERLLN